MKLVSVLSRIAVIAAIAFASAFVNGAPSLALFGIATIAFLALIASHDYSSRRTLRLSIDRAQPAHVSSRQLTLRLAA